MTDPANVREFKNALSALRSRIDQEKDPDALRVLLEYQERLLDKMGNLSFAELGVAVFGVRR